MLNFIRLLSSVFRPLPFTVLALASLLLLSGCHRSGSAASSQASCFLNPQKSLTSLGRVGLVELDNLTTQPEAAGSITESLFEVMQKKHCFGIAVIRRDDPVCKGLPLSGTDAFSLQELDLIHKSLGTDAIMLGTLTQYRPYPRLTIGLRLKIIDLRDGELVWAMEQLWDSTDKSVEKRIEQFFKSQVRSGYEPLEYRVALVSPTMFEKFVSWEVGQALNPGSCLP